MLQNEEQRKAYLHLMTSFVMGTPDKMSNVERETITNKQKITKKIDTVKYMLSPSERGELHVPLKIVKLYSTLQTGTPESEVLKISSQLCNKSGFVIYNDMCKRLYMHICKNVQLWVELTTQNDQQSEAVLTKKGSFETKATWKVYNNNILKVYS